MTTFTTTRPRRGPAVPAASLIGAASLIWASLAAAPALAEDAAVTASIHGTDIVLPIPKGHCALSEEHPADRDRLSLIRRVNEGRNMVLALFADCAALARFRADGTALDGLGSYLAPMSGAKRRYSMTRERFATVMAQKFAGAEGRAAIAQAEAEAKRRVRGVDAGTSLDQNVNLGLMHKDDGAVFSGAVQKWQSEGAAPMRIAVVFGLTIVRGKIVTTQIAAPHEGPESVDRLLAATRTNVRRLIEANGG